MDEKGQISVNTFFGILILLIVFVVYLQIANPIQENLLFPLLANTEYGSITMLLFQLIPLILGALIFIFPWSESRWRQGGMQ